MPGDDEAKLDALLDKLADNVVEAEYQRVNGTMSADAWKMICKSNIQLSGGPVYEPVAKLLMFHLKDTAFAAEVKRQGERLLADYGNRVDDLFSKSGDTASAEGASKVADRSLLAPYNKPVFKIICGEKCSYQDCALPPIIRKFLERLDCKLHARMLKTSSLSLKEMERIRSSLFKGILFTRVISPFLLEPDGPALDIPGTQKPVPHRAFQAWSGATNRSFNLDYKDFVRDFISHGNTHLPDDVRPLYEARQEQVKKNRTEALAKHSKRSKHTKARSMDTEALPQGNDFRRAMEREKLAYKREQGDDELGKTIAFYRERYAGTRTGAERKRFLTLFDQHVAEWKDTEPDVENEDDIELALKKIHREVRLALDDPTPQKAMPASASGSSTKGVASSSTSTSTSTTSELASPRSVRREQYGVAEKAKQEKAREQKFRDALKSFMNKPECADDLEDEEFKQDFENAAWNGFDSGQGLQDASSLLRDLFEATIIEHFIASLAPSGAQSSQPSRHPQVRHFQSLVAVWKKHRRQEGEILSKQVLSVIWLRVEHDKLALANFKSALAGDKVAAARFEKLDAAVKRWRSDPKNFGKPLTGKALNGIWEQLDDQGSAELSPRKEKREKPDRDEPAPGPGQQRVKLEQARKKMEETLAGFITDPVNKDFNKRTFKETFLDSAIAMKKEKGLVAQGPDNLRKLYTSTQIAMYWNRKAAPAGWPDTARDHLASLIHGRCKADRNHVAGDEHFEEYRKLVMTQACRPMLEEFLKKRSSWNAMGTNLQGSVRLQMLQDLDHWINNGAHGNLQELFKSFYQQKLIDAFRKTKQDGQNPTRSSQLGGLADQWIKDHPDSILEWTDLELMWNDTTDFSYLDQILKELQ